MSCINNWLVVVFIHSSFHHLAGFLNKEVDNVHLLCICVLLFDLVFFWSCCDSIRRHFNLSEDNMFMLCVGQESLGNIFKQVYRKDTVWAPDLRHFWPYAKMVRVICLVGQEKADGGRDMGKIYCWQERRWKMTFCQYYWAGIWKWCWKTRIATRKDTMSLGPRVI